MTRQDETWDGQYQPVPDHAGSADPAGETALADDAGQPTIWLTEHLPVLRSAVRGINDDRTFTGAQVRDIAAETGLDPLRVVQALLRLKEDGLVELHLAMSAVDGRVVSVSGDAQRLVGEWPSAEAAADRLLNALSELVIHGSPEERSQAAMLLGDLQTMDHRLIVSLAATMLGGIV